MCNTKLFAHKNVAAKNEAVLEKVVGFLSVVKAGTGPFALPNQCIHIYMYRKVLFSCIIL